MGLEGTESPLSDVSAVAIGRNDLVGSFPVFFDYSFVFCADFVIKDLDIDLVATLGEAFHDGVICRYSVGVLPVGEGCMEDCIGIALICDHDIFLSTARPNGKAATIIRVDLADRVFPDM